jgi:excisionase family DNA binding protein
MDSNSQKLLPRSEAAKFLGVSKACLEKWAHFGRPKLPYIRVGGAVRYRRFDLENFLALRTATSAAAHNARKVDQQLDNTGTI